MKNFVKPAVQAIFNLLPAKNIILFESIPDFSDNARAVFDELLRQGVNSTYRLIWCCHTETALPPELRNIENVECVGINSLHYRYYLSFCAKAVVVSNDFLKRRSQKQYYLYVAHGAAFKGIKDHRYRVPDDCLGCDFVTYSDFMGHYDAKNLQADGKVNLVPLGYARNDTLFDEKTDVKALFPERDFDKLIYWLPTFRQKVTYHQTAKKQYSAVSIPIIHNRTDAERLNAFAREHRMLIVVKPHPLQDTSTLQKDGLSNLVFIDNDFLAAHHVKNYELLGASDALLSDYSSVYYDYLLCDKPIGLCWEDFEEYRENEGFVINPEEVMAGGHKIFNTDDCLRFLLTVESGSDALADSRHQLCDKIHLHQDGASSKRIALHLLSNI